MATKNTKTSRNGAPAKSNSTKTITSSRSSNGTAKKAAPARKPANGKSDMENSPFHQLFMDELKDIYWAEKHLVKALPKMQKAASTTELVDAFADHLEATKGHVSRLEEVFEMLGARAAGKKCEAMSGLVEEAQELISEEDKGAVLDCGLIIAAQKVEHYEIATYGSLRTLANKMGHSDVAEILEQTLEEEKETDSLLTQIAESKVNEEALAED